MGRLAGPVHWRRQMEYEASKAAIEDRRRYIALITPVVHPPASRRQMALLWYIQTHFPQGGLTVGRRGCPPLTDDMRALLGRRYLDLSRRAVYKDFRLPLRNRLKITPAGAEKLGRHRVREEDKHYIKLAMCTGVVR